MPGPEAGNPIAGPIKKVMGDRVRLSSEAVPRWGRRLTASCPDCGIATHRHRTLDYDGVNTYQPQAGPDPAGWLSGICLTGGAESTPDASVRAPSRGMGQLWFDTQTIAPRVKVSKVWQCPFPLSGFAPVAE